MSCDVLTRDEKMKLEELDWRCGSCRAIGWCEPSWSGICLCRFEELENLDEIISMRK